MLRTFITLVRRNLLGAGGALFGTLLGYSQGGRALWIFIVPPCLLAFMVLLDLGLSKALRKPIS
jgi:uncharacterized membrane protein YoaK (UPF0700 family)